MGFPLDSKDSLNRFLAGIERRAFRMAQFASRNPDDAMDLVQEAMLKFTERYTHRPENEWPVLFHRILQNRITDWHRRNIVRKRIFGWLVRSREDEEDNPLERVPDTKSPGPLEEVLRSEMGVALERAIRTLPLRQRQAFLLRAWEGMDIAQTAAVMGCSEGSIKTHYSRAVNTLRSRVEDLAHE